VAGVGTLVLVLVAMVVLRHMRLDRPRRRREDVVDTHPSSLPASADPHAVVVDARER
jgi:hypothetical protein